MSDLVKRLRENPNYQYWLVIGEAADEIERLRAALEQAIERLGGPDVWGALNHGQMQCSQCSTAYIGVEDVIAEAREALSNERS